MAQSKPWIRRQSNNDCSWDFGEEIYCEAPIPLGESSRIACITVEATPQVRQKLQTPVIFDLPVGKEGKVQIILGPSEGEFVWSSEPPTRILQEYSRWHNSKLQEIQDGLEKETTCFKVPDLRACVLEHISAAHLEVDEKIVAAMVDHLSKICQGRSFEELDTEIQHFASEVFTFISMTYKADQHPVASAKSQDQSLCKEEQIQRCLMPLEESLIEEMYKHATDHQWLQDVLSKATSIVKPVAALQQKLQTVARQLLEALTQRVRMELVGEDCGCQQLGAVR